MLLWLTLGLVACATTNPQHLHTKRLSIDFVESGDQILITATNQQETIESYIDGEELKDQFQCVYDLMEALELDDTEYDCPLSELGVTVLGAFTDMINKADEVVITLPLSLLEAPIDYLPVNDQPLFIQKPVSFRISKNLSKQSPPLRYPKNALIISDVTADPQRATQDVAATILDSIYYDVSDAGHSVLENQDQLDLLLFSVHGNITNTKTDNFSFLEGPAGVESFSTTKPKLIYFDSCRLGVSGPFLSHFQAAGSRYYVGPILSNEAGASSTVTMKTFFKHLAKGVQPEAALYLTRIDLWNRYRAEEPAIRAWRAYPFRVYRLN